MSCSHRSLQLPAPSLSCGGLNAKHWLSEAQAQTSSHHSQRRLPDRHKQNNSKKSAHSSVDDPRAPHLIPSALVVLPLVCALYSV